MKDESRIFLMHSSNCRLLRNDSTWPRQRVSALTKLLLASLLLVTFVGGVLSLNWPASSVSFGGFLTYIIAPGVFLLLLTLFFGLRFLRVTTLARNYRLVLGKVTDFKINDGDTKSIRVFFEFKSETGETIRGESESDLPDTTHYQKQIQIGDNVAVQFVDEKTFGLL